MALAAGPAQAERIRAMPLQGLYEDNKGPVAVTLFAEFGPGLYYIDYAGGRVGPVIEKDGGRTVVGIGLNHPKTDAGTIARMASGLRADLGGEARALRTVALSREPFTVKSGDADLSGELVRRADAKPKGSIVIVHGSNDAPRASYGPWTAYLAARGWQVAVFDKPGTGMSSGDWMKEGFVELAGDVRAVAAYARGRLAGRPLGLFGISQAGWVMPLAAKDGGIDFIVSLMGPGATPGAQTLQFASDQLKDGGFTPAEIKTALAYSRLDRDVTLGERRWADVDAAYRKYAAAKARWLTGPPEAEGSPYRAFLARIDGFDVGPYWRGLRVPVLALLGSKDSIVPVEPNARLLKTMLAPNPNAKLVVVAGVNHVGMIAKTGALEEYTTLDRFDPKFFDTFGDWLDERVR